MRNARARALVLVCCLLAVACRPSVRTGSDDILPSRDVAPPALGREVTATPTSATPSPSADEPGTLEIRVEDRDGRRRSDVVVAYRGPARGSAVTGRNGTVRVTLPPGRYDVEVEAGCVGALEINQGRRSEAAVYPATRSIALLRDIEARRRYWGGTPVTWSPDPPWPRGVTASFTFLLFDRCVREPVAAPDTRLDGLRFVPSGHLEVVRTPTGSDEEGTVALRVRCVRAGRAALFLQDVDTLERMDLLALRPTFVPDTPFCG